MLTAIALALIAGQGRQIPGASNATLLMYSYLPGQREVIMGVRDTYPEVRMQVLYDSDRAPSFPAGGGTVTPGGLVRRTLGNVKWSVREDTFAGKRVFMLRCEGDLKEKLSKTMEIDIRDVKAFWVDEEGKIVRQMDQQIRPFHNRVAQSVYHKDHIEMTVDDERGRRATSVYPNIEMDELHAQFKPMMRDGKVVMNEKEYYVFDPFEGKFEKHSVRLSGSAGGTYFAIKFEGGKAFEITNSRLVQTAAISKEGDLLQVNLPKERYLVMLDVPPGSKKNGGD